MGKVLLAAAAYLVAVAMLSQGPLGAIRILGPRSHQALDLVLVAGLIVSPIVVWRVVPGSNLDTTGIIIVEALAIVLLRMAFRTYYVPPVSLRAEPRLAAAASGGAGDGAAAGEGGAPPGAAEPQTTERPVPSTAGGGAGAPAAGEEGGDGAPPGAAEPQTTERPVPSTAWTLGVLTARARRRGSGADGALGGGARRLGTALGRANRRRSG